MKWKKLLPAAWAFCLAIGISNTECAAQEIYLYGGAIRESDTRDITYAWTLEYRQDLTKNWAVSFSWLNEGHFQQHHRDGHALQIWGRTDPLWKGIVLAAGIGPYRYFDTRMAHQEHSYVDSHGWGTVLSFSATCPLYDRWLFSLRSNYINSDRSIDTFSLQAGIGYQLEPFPPGSSPGSPRDKPRKNEITAYFGQIVVNSGESESDTAWSLEYRRSLGRYLDWSVGWMNENNPGPIHRKGMIAELWLTKSFFHDRLSLSLGTGPYLMIDKQKKSGPHEDDDLCLAGIVTMSGAYEFYSPWVIRISWHRTVTDYNRDTDIILGGIGLRF
jgi:hypothetical protein